MHVLELKAHFKAGDALHIGKHGWLAFSWPVTDITMVVHFLLLIKWATEGSRQPREGPRISGHPEPSDVVYLGLQ